MSSIKQSDVASNPNSGSSIVQAANSGNNLPPEADQIGQRNPIETYVEHIEPQNVELDDTGLPGGPNEVEDSGVSQLEGDSVQLRNDALNTAITKLNDFVQNEKRDIEFSVNAEAGVSVVKVLSRQSHELIREIPGEEVVDLARKLNDQEPLRLFSAQV